MPTITAPTPVRRRNVVRAQYLGALAVGEGGWPVLDKDGKVVLVEAEPTRMLKASSRAHHGRRGLTPAQ